MELTKDEESALKGEKGEVLELAYRILVATGEAINADRLV
ncbi:MAG: aconitase X, partial [Nitrosopumilaceae archaeon]|nr:aconitase X [Nitrosopumilaceae archaeon]